MSIAGRVTSNRETVMAFVTMWPWPLTFWPLCQCMPSDYYRVCVPCLVLIAQAVFLLEREQTDRQTQLNALPMPAAIQPACVMMRSTSKMPIMDAKCQSTQRTRLSQRQQTHYYVNIQPSLFTPQPVKNSRSCVTVSVKCCKWSQVTRNHLTTTKPQNELQRPSVNVDPSATSTACCYRNLWHVLQNLTRSSVGASEYSQSVLSKFLMAFMRYRHRGNNICADKWMNKRMD